MTCSMLASLAAIICVLLVGIDNNHSVRPERLILRPWDRDSGVAQWVHAQAIKVKFYQFYPLSISFLPEKPTSPSTKFSEHCI